MVILIADDHADARGSLRALLQLEGHTVLEAANGREAVDAAIRIHPDVILMDLNMPIMDGLGAIRALRADPFTSGIRIIVVSALGNHPEWRKRATQCGCDDCLEKPVDFQSLRRAIEQPAA